MRLLLVIGMLLLTGACSLPPVNPGKFIEFTEIQERHWDADYTIQPRDGLRIDIFPPLSLPSSNADGAPPLAVTSAGTTMLELIVQPDGRISLPRDGGIFLAKNQTCDTLAKTLGDELATRYDLGKIKVSVQVTQAEGWQVFVDGEVTAPGMLEYQPGMTAHQAVASAGGIRYTGNENYVMVIREDFEGNAAAVAMDFELLSAGDALDLNLLPGDVIRVIPTKITRAGRWVQQYIRDLLPVGLGASVGAGV